MRLFHWPRRHPKHTRSKFRSFAIELDTAGAGASTGLATALAVGASLVIAVGVAGGAATSLAVGAATSSATAVSAGVATTAAVGLSTASAVGSSAGTSTTAATGQPSGVISGAATTTAVGASVASAVGSSTGIASATAVADTLSAGVSTGTATATAIGASFTSAVGSSTGSSTTTGVAPGALTYQPTRLRRHRPPQLDRGWPWTLPRVQPRRGALLYVPAAAAAGAGTATGLATATGVGRALVTAVGSSAGSATTTGIAATTAGVSAGLATATGVGRATSSAVGASAGTSTATAVAPTIVVAVGSSVGTSTAQAIGPSLPAVVADVALEFGLSGGAFAAPQFNPDAFGGSDWVDVTTECRSMVPIVCEYGIFDDDPTALVAGAGRLSFALNNAESNAAQTLGWYSPLHAQRRGGFDFNIPVRLSISNGTTLSYKFHGRLADILPTPGFHEDKLVHCTALDLMDDYARLPVPPLATQFDKRGDELIQFILNALPAELQPTWRSINTSLDTHAIAFDRLAEESMTIREAMHEICASEMATAMFIGTTAPGGGLFAFSNRQAAIINPFVTHHFEFDIARHGLSVPGSRDDLVSTVQVSVHPTRVDAAPVVLYALQTTATLVQPGHVNDFLFGPYRDPDNPGERVGGTNMIQPVATTDYTMNVAQDGSGADLTANFTVSASFTGNGVRFTITNTGNIAGYITKLQCRGTGVYRFTAVIERDVPDVAYGHRVLSVDMPYQSNVNTGQDVADYLSHALSRPLSRVRSVRFLANRNVQMLAAMIVLEPGHRIAITEAVTGLDAAEFLITGVRLEIEQGAAGLMIWDTLYLKPADMGRYWTLGTAGASELGDSTVLGY